MSIGQPTRLHSLEPAADSPCGRVLIADDDAMFRRILQTWLESWGYRVVIAEDGEQAWSILQQEHAPELLILDWVMPGIDGTELCRRIREQQRSPYQYILLATGKDDKQDVVRGLEAGADDYLTKPFDRNELRARLRVGRRILTLQKDMIHARDELRFQATHVCSRVSGIGEQCWTCCIENWSVPHEQTRRHRSSCSISTTSRKSMIPSGT